jgi:hypothetical protein
VAAAWGGPCNASFATGSGFQSGIVMLSNSGGTWHATAQACTSGPACGSSGIPNRYISGVKIDTSNRAHAYLSLSGYSRKWMIGPDDPGVGHVFETSNGGTSWTNISGNLPDAPMDDIVYQSGKLVVASDFGVLTSANDGSTWSKLGTNLPNVVVDQLTVDPDGTLVAAIRTVAASGRSPLPDELADRRPPRAATLSARGDPVWVAPRFSPPRHP